MACARPVVARAGPPSSGRPTRRRSGCPRGRRILGPPTTNYIKTPGLVVVVDSLADQGRTDEGEALLVERGMDGELVPTLFSVLPLLARGRLRAAAGDHVRARADFELALEWMSRSRGTWPWRCDAYVALIPVLRAMGDQDAARAVVDQAMQAATVAQSPRRLGGALRVAGLVEGGDAGLELLRQAAGTLATSPALLWRAEAFIDLGAALRSSGNAVSARPFCGTGWNWRTDAARHRWPTALRKSCAPRAADPAGAPASVRPR